MRAAVARAMVIEESRSTTRPLGSQSPSRRRSGALHRSTNIQVYCLYESLILVDEGSVQLVRLCLRGRLSQKVEQICVFASTPFPIDSSLVPSVNRNSVVSCLCKPIGIRQTRVLLKQTLQALCVTTDTNCGMFLGSGILKGCIFFLFC